MFHRGHQPLNSSKKKRRRAALSELSNFLVECCEKEQTVALNSLDLQNSVATRRTICTCLSTLYATWYPLHRPYTTTVVSRFCARWYRQLFVLLLLLRYYSYYCNSYYSDTSAMLLLLLPTQLRLLLILLLQFYCCKYYYYCCVDSITNSTAGRYCICYYY